jgi:hypothetical protein
MDLICRLPSSTKRRVCHELLSGSFERGATCPYLQNAPYLKFVRVVSVSKEVVAGLLWKLTVEVETHVGPAEYKATVYKPTGPDSKRYRAFHILRFKLMSMRHVKGGLDLGLVRPAVRMIR